MLISYHKPFIYLLGILNTMFGLLKSRTSVAGYMEVQADVVLARSFRPISYTLDRTP